MKTVSLKDTFNNVVNMYDAARPTYPKQLLEDVMEFSGKKGRKYCCHDCYIMDRFWSDGDKDRAVVKSPDRKTIKIAL